MKNTPSPTGFPWAKIVSPKRVCYSHVTVISVLKSNTILQFAFMVRRPLSIDVRLVFARNNAIDVL